MTIVLQSSINKGDNFTAPYRIVLREDDNQYVTHWLNLQTNGHCHGHYFPKSEVDSKDKAMTDYLERCSKGNVSPIV